MRKGVFLLAIFVLCVVPALIAAEESFTSSDLPIVVIDTNGQGILDEPKIDAWMGIIHNGSGSRNYLTDAYNVYNGRIGIEIRGSSSQYLPKKQYAVETRDEDGEDRDVSLLRMPEESDWVLYAPYIDKTLIRNNLAYKLANDMGHYASRTQFCELVLNGDYVGIYVLMEKIKRGKNRVNISKLKSDDVSGDDLTGGYIIKLDNLSGQNIIGWFSEYESNGGYNYYQFHYPKQDDIVKEQKDYIQSYICRFEDLMADDNYNDSDKGYAAMIDVGSFIDFLILTELSRNVDGFRLSTFMYKDKDSKVGKLTMGPIWDFDLAFGNAGYCDGGSISGWQADFKYESPHQVSFWWQRLRDDPAFQNKLRTRWRFLRKNVLSKDAINQAIDDISGVTSEARVRNFKRWPELFEEYIYPTVFQGETYEEEITYLKSWIDQRIDWIDQQWQDCVRLFGDVNGDGDVNVNDAILALQTSVGRDVESTSFVCKKAAMKADEISM
ncbi:MAG: CotH kinase family protein, partial [Deltaproteobacteria bacterium]|nr:CotH kinase family protein [Deltaproteobacteria bacterium]